MESEWVVLTILAMICFAHWTGFILGLVFMLITNASYKFWRDFFEQQSA